MEAVISRPKKSGRFHPDFLSHFGATHESQGLVLPEVDDPECVIQELTDFKAQRSACQ
jgi:hypothetical protein